MQKVSSEGLETTNWRVLGDDELPDVTPLAQLWICAHCWRAEGICNPEEPLEARAHLRAGWVRTLIDYICLGEAILK